MEENRITAEPLAHTLRSARHRLGTRAERALALLPTLTVMLVLLQRSAIWLLARLSRWIDAGAPCALRPTKIRL